MAALHAPRDLQIARGYGIARSACADAGLDGAGVGSPMQAPSHCPLTRAERRAAAEAPASPLALSTRALPSASQHGADPQVCGRGRQLLALALQLLALAWPTTCSRVTVRRSGHGACSAHGRQLHAEASHTTDKRWRRLRSTGWPKLATPRPAPIEDGIECGRSRIRRPAAAHLRSAMLARTREQRHRLCATQTGWPSRPRRRLNRPPGPAPASPALQ